MGILSQSVVYNSTLELDLSILRQNARLLRQNLGPGVQIIPVLKDDAYGLGAPQAARALCAEIPVPLIALARLSEALSLRAAGIDVPLLILGGMPREALPQAVEYGIQTTAHDIQSLRIISAEARARGTRHPVQIKINTGLNRFGARPGEELDRLGREILRLGNVSVQGAFTHFTHIDQVGSDHTKEQLALYLQGIAQLESLGIEIPLRHAAASAVTEWFPGAYLDAVRLGRRLFMDAPLLPNAPPVWGCIREAASWRSQVTALQTVKAGETIGYDGRIRASRSMTAAIVCAGYGDGLLPGLAEAGAPVLVNGKRAPLMGCCMDSCFVDVSEIECAIGDEITFFGTSRTGEFLSAQEVAALIGNEGVFLTSALSPRVGRVYKS
jgi:alanine racemase